MKTETSIVFVDSSVLFSACHSQSGYARDLLHAADRGEIRLAVSQFVLTETFRNLSSKSVAGASRLADYVSSGMFTQAEPTQQLTNDVSRYIEPKDAPVVAGAIACGAAVVASFDQRHLLRMTSITEERWGIRVETPGQILASLSGQV